MTYQLGWSVIPQILVRRERWPGGYKTRVVPLVYPGQEVQAVQPVMRLERIDLIEAVATVPHPSLPKAYDTSGVVRSYMTQGSVDAHDQYGGETLLAGLHGRVVNITRRGGVIIESKAALLQGVIGAGSQVAGILTMWQARISREEEQSFPSGCLLVIPGPLNSAMLRQAFVFGVLGVIASSISSRDLESFLRVDLVELIESVDVESAQARLPRMTVLLTEGIGTIAMPTRTIRLLSHYQGLMALLSGATSIRMGVFPELVISLPVAELQQPWLPVQPEITLSLGVQVRVCSGDHEGATGTIDYLYSHQQVFSAGILARAVRLRLEDGSLLTVPLTLVERIS